jgi:sporulation protein YlmC with PRC-barrel domain
VHRSNRTFGELSDLVIEPNKKRITHLVVDDDARITHLLLERGHLWARHELTIPIGAVARIETDGITLSLGKDELRACAEDDASPSP